MFFNGEAWKFTDLNLEDSYIKGITNNKLLFGYFNDSIRDAIKGSEHEVNSPGLIHKYNKEQFLEYTSSIVAGLKNYSFGEIPHSVDSYSLFNEDVGINLNYASLSAMDLPYETRLTFSLKIKPLLNVSRCIVRE
ncbi:hypothetical protein NW062_05605 [Mycoplasmopsis cynos]|nr:hypothetical protein NW062_05605 [Mycoplasmopsis cynos]